MKDLGIKLADNVASFVGSWKFIIWQTVILIVWMVINIKHLVDFDPYPFILMNLLLSSQAAYATPMILMSSNRQAVKDREQLIKDLQVDIESKKLLEDIAAVINKINEDLELDRKAIADHSKILAELNELKTQKAGKKPKN